MKCEEVEHKLLEYLDGELSDEETAALLKHLEECKTCAALLERYRNQERLLERYYETMAKVALGAPKPKLEAPRKVVAPTRRAFRLYAVAAVFGLMLLGGLALFVYHQKTQSKAGQEVGTALNVMGRVFYFEDGKLLPLKEGMPITSRTRLKTTNKSYLAVRLRTPQQAAEPNVVEFKDNSIGAFLAYNDRMVLSLERGEVWVHLNQKPPKPFAVKTRQIFIRDRGTIFNVAQGMTGTLVGMVTGKVEFDFDGSRKVVEPRELFTSFEDKSGDTVRKHIYWSHYREKLLALLGPERAPRAIAETSQRLQVPEIPKPTPTPEVPINEDLGSLDTTELMPINTRFFFEVASVPETISDWESSDYSRLFQDPALVQWWQSDAMSELHSVVVNELGAPKWIELAKSINGSMSFSVTSGGNPILVADCREDFESVRKVLNTDITPLLKRWKARSGVHSSNIPKIHLKQGYLVICWNAGLVKKTLKAIEDDAPTGFTETQFYQNLRDNVPNSRLTIAYDFRSTIAALKKKGDKDLMTFLKRSGLDGLDYVLGSPDFAGRGINQAFRVAFTGPRHGVVGWIDEPSPMGSLRYYGPDVHLLVAARIKRPEQQMFADVVRWSCEDSHVNRENVKPEELQLFRELAACLGNEVALGLENPVLPIPNIQVALEILDPMRFHDVILKIVDHLNAELPGSHRIIMEPTDYREHLIVTLSARGWKFDISYVVLDDFLVVGLGEPFLRHTVDVFEEHRSIIDEYAFTQLLPDAGQLNFSLLLYQDLSRSIPEILNKITREKLSGRERAYLPSFDVMKRFKSTGISYAFSSDKYIDFYIKGSSGVDFNMGGALPLVARLLTPRIIKQDTESKLHIARANLRSISTALEAFYVDNERYPEILEELLSPVAYISEIPPDPFSQTATSPPQYIVNSASNSYVIYSTGPDAADGLGVVQYDPTNGLRSAGDIIVKNPEHNNSLEANPTSQE